MAEYKAEGFRAKKQKYRSGVLARCLELQFCDPRARPRLRIEARLVAVKHRPTLRCNAYLSNNYVYSQ